jgi:small conductance mechanosensitive channel|nr:mechanosensitive ion channel family protein [Candidatus Krumholzibacteria bacterium]
MVRFFITILVLVALGSPSAQAQDPVFPTLESALVGATEEVEGPRAVALLQDVADIIEDDARYHAQLSEAGAEDRQVLRLQIDRTEDRFMAVMKDLAALGLAEGAPSPLKERVITLHQVLIPQLWIRLDEARQRVDELRSRRPETGAADRATLEAKIDRRVARLDILFRYVADHLTTLEGLGRDVTASLSIFHIHLRERTDLLLGRLALGLERTDDLKAQMKAKPDDSDLPLLLTATKHTLDVNGKSLDHTLDLMDRAGIPDEAARERLVVVTQDLASGVMDVTVSSALARKAWAAATDWLAEKGPGYLVKFMVVLLIMAAGWLLASLVRKAVEKSLSRARLNISQLLKRTIVSFTHNVVLGLTVMVALAQFGISLGPLLAGLGVVGFILGFAMQDSLSNFASGLMILFYRPYDVGDLVEISGAFGKVEHMSMVSTSILTLDNQKLVVPNSKIWGDVIKNVTDQHTRRVDMTFGISYSDDIPLAEEVLNKILAECEGVLDQPEPMVRLHTLGESSVDFIVRPWVRTEDYWDVYWAVTREVKMRFDAEQISIPFPQRDVHLYPAAKEGEA